MRLNINPRRDRKRESSRERKESRRGNKMNNWDYCDSRDRLSDGERRRNRGHDVSYSSDKDREYRERRSKGEAGRRDREIQRYDSGRDCRRGRDDGEHSGHTPVEEDYFSGREGMRQKRGSRTQMECRQPQDKRGRPQADAEWDRRPEMRRRGSCDSVEGARRRRASNEKGGPRILEVQQIQDDPPLPVIPRPTPPPPNPLDFPLDRRHLETWHGRPSREREGTPQESQVKRLSTRSNPYLPEPCEEVGYRDDKRAEVDAPHKLKRVINFRQSKPECKGSSKKILSYSILREEEPSVERHASVLLPVLENSEKIFHELVAAGDVEATRAFLLDHPKFNINCVNYQKISALHVAVKEQNEAMVEFLLEQGDLDTSDCALYAIKGGNVRIVEMILQRIHEISPRLEFAGTTHSIKVRMAASSGVVPGIYGTPSISIPLQASLVTSVATPRSPQRWLTLPFADSVRLENEKLLYHRPNKRMGDCNHVDFADDLTPVVLAAQLGNYEMIDFLLKRGHCIPPVHPPFCKCEACKAELKKYDRLRYSTMKLNLYKAICNPMYIFHTTDDPFQRAFELVKELQDAATVFPQFKVSFEELWQNLRKFTTELIGCCRNAQEVEIVLKKSPKSVADHVKFPRLQYAIDLKQKEFVSHPYTQAVLGDAWTGELLEWKVRSPLMQSLSVFPRIPMLPIMTLMCIILPNHSLVRKWKTPVNKMISSVASYVIFLIILFLESNLDKKNQKRGPPNSGLEGVIIIYVIGYIWLNIRTCFKQGIKRFFSTLWHWYDTIMLFLFTMTIVFWIASWVDITANDDIDLPRKYWNALDPELIAEGFFAAAVIMAFFRLNLFLALNYHLGPLQVSIGKMTLDIFRFIIIFFIIILAWCAGLCRFYQPYDGMVQKDAASGNKTTQVPSFVSFLMTLKTFFWAIFGMSPIESADVVIENLPGDTPGTTIINKHQFTEAVGYIAFALFQFLSVVVVLNMLVACMANTFTKVIDNVTVEWVFGRSQIYLSFMASSTLPPPFNLVPTAAGVRDMCRWFRLLAKSSDGQRARCSLTHCCYIESETEAYVNTEFPSLMSELAQRYIRLKAEVPEEECSVLDEIRNEITEIKESLRKLTATSYNRRY